MYLRLLFLELKQFLRNPQFGTNLLMKLLMLFSFFWIAVTFIGMAPLLYFLATEELNEDPLRLLCRYFVYYWAADLVIRYFMQHMPTQNIKPFLTLKLTKDQLVNHTILKTFFHFFNWGNLLFLVPFCGLLIFVGDYSVLGTLMFLVGILFVFYFNNFLNILLNGKDAVFYAVAVVFVALAALEYFGIIRLTEIFEPVFYSLYSVPGAFLIPVVLAALTAWFAHRNIRKSFYLDEGLELKKAEGKTENIDFLNRFGAIGTFLNNDVRLLKRSKAAKSALVASFFFLFYGLLFFNSAYQQDFMKLFAALFVTGGFMFMFGQRVPAWDSSYYPLMMTQNVPYKQFLKAKWSLIIIGTFVSLLLSTAYLFFGLEIYLTVLGAGLYNLGVNSYLTLLAGAFNKQPIDLNSSGKVFGGGGKNNFNMKLMLLMLPQMVLPMIVYAVTKHFLGMMEAVAALGILGIIGFLLRDRIFNLIVKAYRTEKYSTLDAFRKG